MSTKSVSPGTATEILAAAGVEEDHAFYGPFTSEDEKAVLTVPQRIQAAWAANDADIFAEIFTENGSLLMQDNQLTSREEIRSYMAEGFEGVYQGARVTGWPLSAEFLNDDVAMVVTQGGIMLADDTEVAPARQIRATWIIVNQDGQWRLFSHQSSPIQG
ncbi:SgcJ/EcaC family oxidoreductase [Actinokineospora sp.]|uniref:SgcJ/EcaC family oxidoreductase n=1 Tax=Actinokineospora sp. TaxID=1872133 RepID=UPI004037CF6E